LEVVRIWVVLERLTVLERGENKKEGAGPLFCCLVLKRASEKLDALHQFILVRARDGNLIVVNFDDELEGVDVGNAINVDDVVSAHPHKVFEGQFEEQILQAGLDIVLALSHVDGAVLAFDFNEAHVLQVNAAQLIAHFREEMLGAHLAALHFLECTLYSVLDGYRFVVFALGQDGRIFEQEDFVLHFKLFYEFCQGIFLFEYHNQIWWGEQTNACGFGYLTGSANITTELGQF